MRPAVADYPAGAHTPTRMIDDYELVWMLRGRARLVGEDGDWLLVPGRLALVPPGVRHGFVWDERRPCRHGYVHFESDHLGGARARGVTVRPMTADDPLAGLCTYLLWLGRTEPDGWVEPAERALRHVVALLVAGPLPPAGPPPTLAGPVAAAIDRLGREWAEMPLRRVTVGELASAVSVSRGYLERLFRASFGMGVAAALERVRCSRAETLLARTDLTLDVVARQCGFADGSHFSHRFAALYGLPPTEHRRSGQVPSMLDDPNIRRLAGLIWD
jgi:AraC family transcriptional regulator